MTQNSIKNGSMSKIMDYKSVLDENNSSAWMAKKQRSKVEKDLVILQNRINLLSLEDRKAKNKFQKTKKQTEKVLQLKKNIDETRIYVNLAFPSFSSILLLFLPPPLLSLFFLLFILFLFFIIPLLSIFSRNFKSKPK